MLTLVDINSNDLLHYPVIASVNKCGRIYNTTDGSYAWVVCASNKVENINIKVFN